MLFKIIDSIKEYFYTPKIGDRYFYDIRPGLLFNPWECEKIRKEIITIIDVKEGYVKFTDSSDTSYIGTNIFYNFKRNHKRIK